MYFTSRSLLVVPKTLRSATYTSPEALVATASGESKRGSPIMPTNVRGSLALAGVTRAVVKRPATVATTTDRLKRRRSVPRAGDVKTIRG